MNDKEAAHLRQPYVENEARRRVRALEKGTSRQRIASGYKPAVFPTARMASALVVINEPFTQFKINGQICALGRRSFSARFFPSHPGRE